ncbi:MAG TPA: hypothetical protein VKI44_34690 [Acetobacteraceae bacterium]|nr:hypothetical protein [Acetobacteraceae bacterium]
MTTFYTYPEPGPSTLTWAAGSSSATLSALVLGLLIAAANNFRISTTPRKPARKRFVPGSSNSTAWLRRSGPDAQPARDILKGLMTRSYERVWQGDNNGTLTMPTIAQTAASMDTMFETLNRLRETAPDARKYLLVRAAELAALINNQRLQISLQLNNSISRPFMTILVAWACLLFFGFGMQAPLYGAPYGDGRSGITVPGRRFSRSRSADLAGSGS